MVYKRKSLDSVYQINPPKAKVGNRSTGRGEETEQNGGSWTTRKLEVKVKINLHFYKTPWRCSREFLTVKNDNTSEQNKS